MSENGTPAPVQSAFDRFLSLAQRGRKAKAAERAPVPVATPAQLRAEALEGWLREDAAQTYIVWIDEMIATARLNAHTHRASHSEVVYWMGVEAALVILLDEANRIRGQAI